MRERVPAEGRFVQIFDFTLKMSEPRVITEDLEEPYPALAGAIAGNYFSLQEHLPISHRDARFIAFEKSPDENRLDFDNVISKIVTSCPAYVYFEWQLPEECFSFVDCLVAITLSQ